ncbi:four-carbon acid sugar kinase family protein [Pusillimonas sp. ANT_WB101]|uniref:four-carbon acid sugar kinase family protein n=1 Tax=Pusillimonas sp. ANT_WB101 TaxID=2597356 RepID=UPI0011EE7527|nr:four-carbon acid sugar kinase family protein [Pusillimonas sp. ANT_WB101]KAA0892872.1 four-carbon acid sugar kinase family protein [Pusillimonas sp. ANT_WB101]
MAFKLAFYADDFTGATDTLATLARQGQRAMLFLRVPSDQELAHAGPLDCVGIAGAARSMQNQDQTAELEAVAAYLKGTGAPVIHYKTCSTFDSSAQVGSIGLAVRVLRKNLKTGGFTPIVGGQPNLGRYCVFSNLFAAFQTGAEAFRIDRHPTMSCHPVTPMGEADLRHHLAEQGLAEISAVQYPSYEKSDEALDEQVDAAITQGPDGVLFDVACPAHLPVIGRQIWQRALRSQTLAVGPSSVAQALLAHWQAMAPEGAARVSPEEDGQLLGSSCANAPSLGAASDQNQTAQGAETAGPVLVLSGSMSPLTARQIEVATSYLHIPIPVADLLGAGSQARAGIVKRIKQGLQAGRNVLAHLVHAEQASSADQAVDPATLARASGSLLAEVLQTQRPARLGLAGGDTSSLAILSLDVWGLTYIGQIDPGVALCRLHSNQASLDGLDVMLKGGQMGSLGVFEKLAKKADTYLKG